MVVFFSCGVVVSITSVTITMDVIAGAHLVSV